MAELPSSTSAPSPALRHWKLEFDGSVACLTMDVNEAGLRPGYQLRLNSMTSASISSWRCRAAPALRHPRSRRGDPQPARPHLLLGRRINMLGLSTRPGGAATHQRTRLAIEDATAFRQSYICSINGIAAGGIGLAWPAGGSAG
jgi:benzoyl-CoA-dihydrodiol lyase